MPVIAEDAETKLVEHLASLKGERDRWNVAVVNGSQMEAALQRVLRSTESQIILAGIARDAGMAGYFCQDADIVLLFDGKREDNHLILEELVRELLPHLQPEDIDLLSVVSFFELRYDFDVVTDWAQKKHQLTNQAGNQKREQPIQEITWDQEKFNLAVRLRPIRRRKLIAVADDDQTQRQLVRSVLRSEYDVILAHHGFEALELYNICVPDLLFLDIRMPHLDGIAVLERIMKADPAAQVVMFSTLSHEKMLKDAIERGAKGFVAKPFTAQTLMQYTKRLLG